MCQHLRDVERGRTEPVRPGSPGCEECLETGGEWVHLRLCLACGHVGCCDSSPGRHASAHHHATRHPVMRSFEPGESWGWCYAHGEMVEDLPALPGEAPPRHFEPPTAH